MEIIKDLSAVAVTSGPGLIGALHVGLQAAKTISLVHDIPLISVHHLAGHIYANNLVKKKMTYRELIVIYSMIEYLLNISQKPYVDSGSLIRVQIDEKPIITPNNIDYRFGNIQKFVSFIGSDSATLQFREKIINLIDEYLKGDQSIISEIKQL